ncbi:MAG: hypothetical protein ACI9TY_000507 [Alphaproteobacteria bacterium]|jgi:hypothetical protein
MEILYTAIEEKQAELEESLLTVQHRKEHIKRACDEKSHGKAHNFTRQDQENIRLEELSMQENEINVEYDILNDIQANSCNYEDMRLAARSAHTCILENNSLSTSLNAEEDKLERLSSKAERTYQDLIIEYKRLKKSPPAGLTQEELLILYMGHERKIACERVKRDLFTIMAQQLQYERSSCKSEDILNPEIDGLAI